MSDVSKTNELIEKLALAAEDAAGGPPSAEQVDALIAYADALRDALEAATRVPVQGEPNNDRATLQRVAEEASRQRLNDSMDEWRIATGNESWAWPEVMELEMWHAGYKEGAWAMIEHQLSRATVPDAATAEAKKQLGEIQRHFTAIAGSGEIRVYEDTGEKHGIDYQSSVWAKRGERMTRDLIEFLGEHHRPEPVGNGESK